jgi:hypothetical protein
VRFKCDLGAIFATIADNGRQPPFVSPANELLEINCMALSGIVGYDECLAEREGFEPSIRFGRIHAFQACALDRSAISPVVAGRCPFRREARSIEQTFHKVKMPLPTSITAKHESDLKISYENPKHDDDKRREQPDMLIYHEPRRDEAGDLKDR